RSLPLAQPGDEGGHLLGPRGEVEGEPGEARMVLAGAAQPAPAAHAGDAGVAPHALDAADEHRPVLRRAAHVGADAWAARPASAGPAGDAGVATHAFDAADQHRPDLGRAAHVGAAASAAVHAVDGHDA